MTDRALPMSALHGLLNLSEHNKAIAVLGDAIGTLKPWPQNDPYVPPATPVIQDESPSKPKMALVQLGVNDDEVIRGFVEFGQKVFQIVISNGDNMSNPAVLMPFCRKAFANGIKIVLSIATSVFDAGMSDDHDYGAPKPPTIYQWLDAMMIEGVVGFLAPTLVSAQGLTGFRPAPGYISFGALELLEYLQTYELPKDDAVLDMLQANTRTLGFEAALDKCSLMYPLEIDIGSMMTHPQLVAPTLASSALSGRFTTGAKFPVMFVRRGMPFSVDDLTEDEKRYAKAALRTAVQLGVLSAVASTRAPGITVHAMTRVDIVNFLGIGLPSSSPEFAAEVQEFNFRSSVFYFLESMISDLLSDGQTMVQKLAPEHAARARALHRLWGLLHITKRTDRETRVSHDFRASAMDHVLFDNDPVPMFGRTLADPFSVAAALSVMSMTIRAYDTLFIASTEFARILEEVSQLRSDHAMPEAEVIEAVATRVEAVILSWTKRPYSADYGTTKVYNELYEKVLGTKLLGLRE